MEDMIGRKGLEENANEALIGAIALIGRPTNFSLYKELGTC